MKRFPLALAFAAIIGTGAALAAGDPIKERQDLMKDQGAAMKSLSGMLKGEKPYDAKVAGDAMKTIYTSMDKFVTLFPKGSETGDTDAKPEIWTAKADFDTRAKATQDAASKAEQAAPSGIDVFRSAMANVGNSCKSCHEKYRVEKKK